MSATLAEGLPGEPSSGVPDTAQSRADMRDVTATHASDDNTRRLMRRRRPNARRRVLMAREIARELHALQHAEQRRAPNVALCALFAVSLLAPATLFAFAATDRPSTSGEALVLPDGTIESAVVSGAGRQGGLNGEMVVRGIAVQSVPELQGPSRRGTLELVVPVAPHRCGELAKLLSGACGRALRGTAPELEVSIESTEVLSVAIATSPITTGRLEGDLAVNPVLSTDARQTTVVLRCGSPSQAVVLRIEGRLTPLVTNCLTASRSPLHFRVSYQDMPDVTLLHVGRLDLKMSGRSAKLETSHAVLAAGGRRKVLSSPAPTTISMSSGVLTQFQMHGGIARHGLTIESKQINTVSSPGAGELVPTFLALHNAAIYAVIGILACIAVPLGLQLFGRASR
jgi:hypothetical protein